MPQTFPLKSDKIPDATHLGPGFISTRTRSKVCEAKAVQTEPITVSVGTNTTTRDSFSHVPDAVLEFPEYQKMGATVFTWSEANDQRNQCFVDKARKYGRDWWNADKKKRRVAKRLAGSTVFAKRASLVPNFSGVTVTQFQSLTFGNGPESYAMSDGRRLEPGQLRGHDERRQKRSHSRSQPR